MSSWPGSLAVAVRRTCLGAARFVGVVSRCGSYGRSARSSMRCMTSLSSTVSTWAETLWSLSLKHPIACWDGTRPGARTLGPGGALMSRIAPPALVVTDGGSGFAKACKRIWPTTRVQRCTFHAYCRIRQATTTRPKLEASRSLYALGRQLTHVTDIEDAQEWIGAYQGWCTRWKGFLEEKTRRPEGDGNTPTNVSFERVTASTSSSPRGSCSPTWTPPGTTRCPQQPTRSKARTPNYARYCATTAACA